MSSTFRLAIVIVLICLNSLGTVSCAGENDDKTFDWLRDDDHIISSQDLQFLQQHGHSHSQANPQVIPIPSPQHVKRPSQASQHSSDQPKSRRGRGGKSSISDSALARLNGKNRLSSERYRNRVIKPLKLTNPEADRKRRERKNQMDKERRARFSKEEKKEYLQKQKVRDKERKAARAGMILSPEQHEEQKRKRREKRKRYEKNLGRKIKAKQATDKQKQSFINQFGVEKFTNLFTKD